MINARFIVLAATALSLLAGCGLSTSRNLPEDWELVTENDFSYATTDATFLREMIEGDAAIRVRDGILEYEGDSVPDDKIWILTKDGFTSAAGAYKMSVEPAHGLWDSSCAVSFHLWSASQAGRIAARLEAGQVRLDAWGAHSYAVHLGVAEIPARATSRPVTFELTLDGGRIEARLLDRDTQEVFAVVHGLLRDTAYYGSHDIRLRCDGSGFVAVDNLRLYRRKASQKEIDTWSSPPKNRDASTTPSARRLMSLTAKDTSQNCA